MARRRSVCEASLRWILNYRMVKKVQYSNEMEYNRSMRRLVNCDLHSDESLRWTVHQSTYIDKYGWDKWFRSDGPTGFQ
jgi:hypothetical protein